jgi:hypothetical protein
MRAPRGNDLILGKLAGRAGGLGLSRTERDKHLYVCGGTGTGKSKFLENIIRQDIRNWSKSKCGVLVFDPHGSLYDNLINWLAWTEFDRPIIPIDLRQDDWVVSYNLLRQRKCADPAVLVDIRMKKDIKRGVDEKLRRGEWPGANRPLGYLYDHRLRNIVPDPKTAKIVQAVFAEHSKGNFSLLAASEFLFSHGVKSRTGRPWSACAVHHFLTNRIYTGIMTWNGEVFEGKFKPLISPELFRKVQAALKGRAKPRKIRNGHAFPFCGTFHCSCGAMMSAQWGKGHGGRYRYSRCTRKGARPCRQPYLREESVAEQSVKILSPLAISREEACAIRAAIARQEAEEAGSCERRMKDTEKRLEPVRAKLQRLTHAYLDELIDEDDYKSAKEALLLEKTALKAEKERLRRTRSGAWIEPALEVVNRLETMGNETFPTTYSAIAEQVRKIGTNPVISGKTVTFSLSEPYASIPSLLASARFATPASRASLTGEDQPVTARISF